MGYSYFFIADHVLGADPAHHNHTSYGMYNHQVVVNESLTLMGYLSAIVPGMGFATGILILPQRQTALVAKQAAEIDVLCGGRLHLCIAFASLILREVPTTTGWSPTAARRPPTGMRGT